jgi:hypothetical protein
MRFAGSCQVDSLERLRVLSRILLRPVHRHHHHHRPPPAATRGANGSGANGAGGQAATRCSRAGAQDRLAAFITNEFDFASTYTTGRMVSKIDVAQRKWASWCAPPPPPPPASNLARLDTWPEAGRAVRKVGGSIMGSSPSFAPMSVTQVMGSSSFSSLVSSHPIPSHRDVGVAGGVPGGRLKGARACSPRLEVPVSTARHCVTTERPYCAFSPYTRNVSMYGERRRGRVRPRRCHTQCIVVTTSFRDRRVLRLRLRNHCPGRKPPFLAVKRPTHLCKTPRKTYLLWRTLRPRKRPKAGPGGRCKRQRDLAAAPRACARDRPPPELLSRPQKYSV